MKWSEYFLVLTLRWFVILTMLITGWLLCYGAWSIYVLFRLFLEER